MKTCNFKSFFAAAALFVIFFALPGCAGNYGRIAKDNEVNQSFLNAEVKPDYNYYYTGPDGIPSAILRIREDYELVGDLWKRFTPSASLGQKVANINFYYRDRVRYYPYGYRVVYCNGETVGGWYSIWDWTAVECLEDKKINVYPPPLGEPFRNGKDDDKRNRFD